MRFHLRDAAGQLAFVDAQRSHIETQVNETLFPEIQYPSMIPVDNTASPWVETITYRSAENYGEAKFINSSADDIPVAGREFSKSVAPVKMAGIGYEFGYGELQSAAAMGINLPADDAIAARQTSERFIDKIAFVGDEANGVQGLFNYNGVGIEAAGAVWTAGGTTEDVILKDFNKLIGGDGTVMPKDTVVLPFTLYTYLASTPLANKTAGTLLTYILQFNAYTAMTGLPLVIRAHNRLTGAAAGGSGNRAVAYTRNPRVLKMHVPLLHTFLPAQQSGLNFVVPGIMRLSGLEIRNKESVRYMDGV